MALVDMKSNLAIGAGKPLGGPEGRHDPDPDLATSTLDEIYGKFGPKKRRVTKKQMTEADLLGELAKLMTKLDYHTEKEEYEVCAEIKKQIDEVNDKLSKL